MRTSEWAPSAPDHDPGGDGARHDARAAPSVVDRRHPVPAQHGARGHGALDQPGVEHPPRDDPHLATHGALDPDVAAGELEAPQRRPVVDHVAGPHLGEGVEHVRGDPVAARLVAGEVACGRAAARAAPGRAASAPSAAADPAGPAPTTTRSHCSGAVIGPTTSSTASTSAIATAATNGTRPRVVTTSATRTATSAPRPPATARATGRAHAGRPRRPRASTAPATGAIHRSPRRCGSPRTPVARSSSTSGRTLTRWAPTPSSPAATGHHHGGSVTVGEGDEDRQAAERTGVGQPRPDGRLQAEVVGPPAGDAAQVDQSRARARPRARARRRAARRRRTRSGTAVTEPAPVASGLSLRALARSRARSTRSLLQPMESCPASTASTTSAARPASRPCATRRAGRRAGRDRERWDRGAQHRGARAPTARRAGAVHRQSCGHGIPSRRRAPSATAGHHPSACRDATPGLVPASRQPNAVVRRLARFAVAPAAHM